jgi:hypothetical protein
MCDIDAALRHHLDQIPIRLPKADIPTHAQLNDVGVERALAVDRITVNRLRHSAPLQGPRILLDGLGCTRTKSKIPAPPLASHEAPASFSQQPQTAGFCWRTALSSHASRMSLQRP